VHRLRGLGIDRQAELLLPVEGVARTAERVVAIAGALAVTRDVGGVRGDLVGDEALFHVVGPRQAEVLLRRDVAEHRGAGGAGHGGADGAGDVIVAGRDVGHERAEHVERRLVAEVHLLLHVHLDLVERHVTRAFDHHLDVLLPRALGELAQRLQLGELRGIARVGEAAGAQTVAGADGHVVLRADLEDLVPVRVERVLFVVLEHPLRHHRAAARHDAGDAIFDERQVFDEHAGVDGEVVDALLGLVLEDVDQVVGGELLDVLHLLQRLVDRHRAERHRARVDQRLTDAVDVPAGREVHHGVGAVLEADRELGELARGVAGDGAVADVRVDLAQRRDADRHRLDVRVVHVRGDDHAAARDLGAHELGLEALAFGDVLHLFGDRALPSEVHLRLVRASLAFLDPRGSEGHGCRLRTGARPHQAVVDADDASPGGVLDLRRGEPRVGGGASRWCLRRGAARARRRRVDPRGLGGRAGAALRFGGGLGRGAPGGVRVSGGDRRARGRNGGALGRRQGVRTPLDRSRPGTSGPGEPARSTAADQRCDLPRRRAALSAAVVARRAPRVRADVRAGADRRG
jgi:hypothetical protein